MGGGFGGFLGEEGFDVAARGGFFVPFRGCRRGRVGRRGADFAGVELLGSPEVWWLAFWRWVSIMRTGMLCGKFLGSLIASRQCAIMPPDLISAIITGTIEASKSLVGRVSIDIRGVGWAKGAIRLHLQCCVENADEEIRVGLQVPRDEILVLAGDAVDLHCDFDEWVFRVNVA